MGLFYYQSLSKKRCRPCAQILRRIENIKGEGHHGQSDDEAEQTPVNNADIQQMIRDLLPKTDFDLIITHNLAGEYTKHLRHEEVSKAVMHLWRDDKIKAETLWAFAYEDGTKAYFPKAVEQAHLYNVLTKPVWLKKYDLITKIYGFKKDTWEAHTTPKAEAFWVFHKDK